MKSRFRAINLYLACCLLLLGGACQNSPEAKKKKELTFLRVHLEARSTQKDRIQEAAISRANPVKLSVENPEVLHEGYLEKAEILPVMEDGFVIRLHCTQKGTWLLESITASNVGRRLAIFADFEQTRWLAAPVVNRRISDGILTFTPDANREESERIVRGINNGVEKRKKNSFIE